MLQTSCHNPTTPSPKPLTTATGHWCGMACHSAVGSVQPAAPPAQAHSLINNSKQQLDTQTPPQAARQREHTQRHRAALSHHATLVTTLALLRHGKAPTSLCQQSRAVSAPRHNEQPVLSLPTAGVASPWHKGTPSHPVGTRRHLYLGTGAARLLLPCASSTSHLSSGHPRG